MKLTQTILKNGQKLEFMVLYDDVNQESTLTASDGIKLLATSEGEFGYESKFEIILEREEFEQIKKL